MKKNIILFLCILFLNVFTLFTTISYFISSDTNYDSFIQIGKLQIKELSSVLYATTGEKLRYKIDIPFPHTHSYDYLKALKDSPYSAWAYVKNQQIIDMINMKNAGITPAYTHDLVHNNDKKYFQNNYISFDSNPITGFSSEKGFHLFFVIYNNAHLANNTQKIKLSSDMLNFEASVSFKGESTGRIWDTYYKENIDFNHNKYYVTRAYSYNTEKKNYEELKRGSWSFYNNADLIIVDLGITGDIEMKKERWSIKSVFGSATHFIKQQMTIPFNSKIDENSRVFKAKYNVIFTPHENKIKSLTNSLYLGEF